MKNDDLTKMSINDIYYQLYKNIDDDNNMNEANYLNKRNKMLHCKHLLVLLGGNPSKGYVVECLKCGITNKFNDLIKLNGIERIPLVAKCFNEWDKLNQDYISNEVLNSYHIGILYRISYKLKPYGTREEIFNLMKELNEMETYHRFS